jgi:hypothetical protein
LQSPDVNVKWLERYKLQQKYEDTTKKLHDARTEHDRIQSELVNIPVYESSGSRCVL